MSKDKDQNSLPAQRSRARHYAMQALYQWSVSKNPLHVTESEFHTDNDMSNVDIPYFRELVHQVPARLSTLETDFLPFVTDFALDEIDPISLALLRMGTYELRYRLDVPYKVVINEALRLAKKFGATDSYKFINGVLDRVAGRLRLTEVQAARRG
jgi:N utilization substance protein B